MPTTSWIAPDTSAPLTHYPPGFPTLLATPIAAGLAPLESARLIIVVAAFITWAALLLLIGEAAGTTAGVVGALAALATPAILTQYLSVLSEPSFLAAVVITVSGMTAMARASSEDRSAAIGWALATGLGAAAAVMLRYAGLAIVAAAATWSILLPVVARADGWWVRIRRADLVIVPTVVALGPWLIHTRRMGAAHSVRTLGYYPGFGATALEGLHTVAKWLVPIEVGPLHRPLAAACAAVVAYVAITAWQELRARQHSPDGTVVEPARRARVAIAAMASVGVVYFLFLTLSRLVADSYIPFDERLLSPLLMLAGAAFTILVAVWWRGRMRAARVGVALLLSLWFASSAFTNAKRISVARDDGGDFAGIDWRDSPTVAWVRAPTGGLHRVLYTNWPAAVYFQANRASHDIPGGLDPLTLRRFGDRLARTRGVLVGFRVPSPDAAPPDSLARTLGLREIGRFDDGAVWGLPAVDTAVAK